MRRFVLSRRAAASAPHRWSLTLIACLVLLLPVDLRAEERIQARVSKILDGDTFTLSGTSRRIRVWGLDAPERNERGGSTATRTLRSLISGQTLDCRVRDMDRYGRIVGQCFLPDGRDIAAEMIRLGVATEYCRFSRGYYGTC
ncbi:thermonuclease family protein [Phaeovulum sp. NW3]|uniref:thermonuclease family protein n=1 Tax=Phaeovulum sp. NW3 TaxID=2934933 RepID=UPI0020215890|nr:thermonuclease family protein [Phaeovulum sp. NW3]MCL7466335.1 thermonuclease family protein [Phaeovulum sp. NW3]